MPRPTSESAIWLMSPSQAVTRTSSQMNDASRNIWSSVDRGIDSGAACAITFALGSG